MLTCLSLLLLLLLYLLCHGAPAEHHWPWAACHIRFPQSSQCLEVLDCCATELGLLSGIAAILRFPINDPDENEDENGADSSSDTD